MQNIIHHIEIKYDELSRIQKKIAAVILNNPEEACFYSLKELSERSGATEKTIINFTKKLGIENYATLKKELQGYIARRLTPDEKIFSALEYGEIRGNKVVSSLCEHEERNVQKTLSALDPKSIELSCALIKAARNVYIIGNGTSEIIADFIYMRLRSIGISIKKIDIRTHRVISTQLFHMTKDDLIIACAFPQYEDKVLSTLSYLHREGIPTIAISDSMSSRVAQNATITLASAVDTPIFFNSLTAPIMVANILTSALVMQMEEQIKDNKLEIERIRCDLTEQFQSLK